MNALLKTRRRRYRILFGYVGIWAALGFIHPVFAAPLALVAFPRFRFWLYRLFCSQIVCPTCGTTLPLMGSWRCGGCGFVQHRHAFAPCVKCGLFVGEVPCPHCEHGILL